MQTTTLSFANLHNHGELFANLLRARKKSFIEQNKWDLPEAMDMEYDQYDTPASRWVAIHENGIVRAGLRLTPTTARCGIYSYMIRDAQRGLLDTIPSDLLYGDAPVSETVWEVTRGFVDHATPAHLRRRVHAKMVLEMTRFARTEGISEMLALLPSNWNRWAGRCALDMRAAGRNMEMGGIDYQAVRIRFAASLH